MLHKLVRHTTKGMNEKTTTKASIKNRLSQFLADFSIRQSVARNTKKMLGKVKARLRFPAREFDQYTSFATDKVYGIIAAQNSSFTEVIILYRISTLINRHSVSAMLANCL